jgi:NADH-quinone oxidoreductase subunit C
LPSEAETAEETPVQIDEARNALLEALSTELGDALVGSYCVPGRDLTIRVTTESWGDTASYLRERQRFRYFSWLSAIDWMPSPFGRSLDAEVDKQINPAEVTDAPDPGLETGTTGGDSRFQVLARVHSLTTNLGLSIKVDVPGVGDDDLTIASWTSVYPGANWHEREAYEMFGISFVGHPGLRKLYLPGNFEGHPLRKDFPLLARLVKPWPGIVDVEPMPEVDEPDTTAAVPSTENPEDVPGEPS